MNAGKSTNLIQAAHNYEERGMAVKLYSYCSNRISSRIGIEKEATPFNEKTLLYGIGSKAGIDCIMVDEAQFLTKDQVNQLADAVDELKIPVLCYGIRTDFLGRLFTGSERLLAIADKLVELKGVCLCGRKATMVLRLDEDGNVVNSGPQTLLGREDKYEAVCRKHFNRKFNHGK